MLCNSFLFLTVVTSPGYSFQPEDELRKNSKYCTRYLFPRISGNESIRINLRVILLEVIRWPWILDYLRQSHHESPGRGLMGLFVVRGIECGSEFNGGAGDYIRLR